MTTAEFIIALFYRIDNQMACVPKHPYGSNCPVCEISSDHATAQAIVGTYFESKGTLEPVHLTHAT